MVMLTIVLCLWLLYTFSVFIHTTVIFWLVTVHLLLIYTMLDCIPYIYTGVLCHYDIGWTGFSFSSPPFLSAHYMHINYTLTMLFLIKLLYLWNYPFPLPIHFGPSPKGPLYIFLFSRDVFSVTSARRSGLHAPGLGGTGVLSHLPTVTAAYHPAHFTI